MTPPQYRQTLHHLHPPHSNEKKTTQSTLGDGYETAIVIGWPTTVLMEGLDEDAHSGASLPPLPAPSNASGPQQRATHIPRCHFIGSSRQYYLISIELF